MITGSDDGHIKRISVENREVDKDLGQVCEYESRRMKITADGERLIVSGWEGRLK